MASSILFECYKNRNWREKRGKKREKGRKPIALKKERELKSIRFYRWRYVGAKLARILKGSWRNTLEQTWLDSDERGMKEEASAFYVINDYPSFS